MKPLGALVDQGCRDLDGPISGGIPTRGETQMFQEKQKDTIRFVHWNIRGFLSGYHNFYMAKLSALQHFSLTSGADVLFRNEINAQWPLLPSDQRIDAFFKVVGSMPYLQDL